MRAYCFPHEITHRYRVDLHVGERTTEPAWYFPACGAPDASVMSWRTYSEYGESPSAELRTLIEAGAPWYAVLDKLSEEYPQWQHHFDEAIRRHQAG